MTLDQSILTELSLKGWIESFKSISETTTEVDGINVFNSSSKSLTNTFSAVMKKEWRGEDSARLSQWTRYDWSTPISFTKIYSSPLQLFPYQRRIIQMEHIMSQNLSNKLNMTRQNWNIHSLSNNRTIQIRTLLYTSFSHPICTSFRGCDSTSNKSSQSKSFMRVHTVLLHNIYSLCHNLYMNEWMKLHLERNVHLFSNDSESIIETS